MPVRIVTADERLSAVQNKTSLAIFGPPGVGKTSLLKTLPPDRTVCLDLEAGMKSVQDWPGPSIPVRTFADFRDLAVLIGGPDPSADPNAWYSAQHHQHVRGVYAGSGVEELLASAQPLSRRCRPATAESFRRRSFTSPARTSSGRGPTPIPTATTAAAWRGRWSSAARPGASSGWPGRRPPPARPRSSTPTAGSTMCWPRPPWTAAAWWSGRSRAAGGLTRPSWSPGSRPTRSSSTSAGCASCCAPRSTCGKSRCRRGSTPEPAGSKAARA